MTVNINHHGEKPLLSGNAATDLALAANLLDMIGASWMSQAICVAAELELPDLLANGSRTVAELAVATGCTPASLLRLMRALASIGIFDETDDGNYALSDSGALLRKEADNSVRSWAIWWGRHLWPVWHELGSSVRTGRSARERTTGSKGYAHVETDTAAAFVFNRAMAELTQLVTKEMLRTFDFAGVARVADIGGGYGELLIAILKANPAMQGILYDLPHAMMGAEPRVVQNGLGSRCSLTAGNFFESVPAGCDLYFLKSILHNWDDEHAALILRNCRRAMPQHARLVLIERTMPEHMSQTLRERAAARTDLNMLVGLGGRERRLAEFSQLLHSVGFVVAQVQQLAPEYSLITCEGV